MNRKISITAAFYIFISIILGAIGAHFVEKHITDISLLDTFDKGVKYLLYTGFGLLIIGLNEQKFNFKLRYFYALEIIGSLLFSVNIFLYIFHETIPALKSFVHIVPVGGSLMIIGWGVLIYNLIRKF